jgi:hypothetical protein
LHAIQQVFEEIGIEFIGTQEEGQGVRLKLKNSVLLNELVMTLRSIALNEFQEV